MISIHALREESDWLDSNHWCSANSYFNPRSPWGERPISKVSWAMEFLFQSTLSVRRATLSSGHCGCLLSISIHALREESDSFYGRNITLLFWFQSTLSVRRATISLTYLDFREKFLSTLSVRRATFRYSQGCIFLLISIHALREESDFGKSVGIDKVPISIHALREESDSFNCKYLPFLTKFQSTLSVRRATLKMYFQQVVESFFQSTLSVRRATQK